VYTLFLFYECSIYSADFLVRVAGFFFGAAFFVTVFLTVAFFFTAVAFAFALTTFFTRRGFDSATITASTSTGSACACAGCVEIL